ncbi:CRISPR-associated endonuclease Cas2 [Bacillus pseudomycoides]|uniref:CRISPR-associated endonuclease Cas2 n=1 Tax=Bacillus pseudomycoides TaxID=64104 RepID=UPI000BEE6A28|nr:CRISPR-associated endonuclease Cas2 [Bacillus pseudomycoides]PED07576.1 CRISPR-associated endonuclease Cas2 [Bacillus pseudomycoides]PEI99882.1 CRISPR-associated endonuclease Cas2 [Bacillus pseudomycoides]PEK11353.1 CRISPR-associated endonuclease Cas2 [Bacillus pseudomycoides]PEM62101.1 CRISPR-associated endonuclease Cas2 [Bacillus pseudomycoides]PEO16512.1 CRISPR-associated endonuclease Cas2 [Bacillus pseudomycoides]
MFVIVSYDVEVKRVSKVHKVLKKYLQWTQNSVFEGEITEGKLKKCMHEISEKINPAFDSVYVYRVANPRNIRKDIYGCEKDFETMFL